LEGWEEVKGQQLCYYRDHDREDDMEEETGEFIVVSTVVSTVGFIVGFMVGVTAATVPGATVPGATVPGAMGQEGGGRTRQTGAASKQRPGSQSPLH
jgi:hypothetical protein